MSAKPSENEKPKPIARGRERSWIVACGGAIRNCGARRRRRLGATAVAQENPDLALRKKIEQGGRPCSQDAYSTLRYASKLLGDRDGGGFAPACSSQDLDRVDRWRCSPLGPAGGTLAHLAWFVIKVKTSRKAVKSLAPGSAGISATAAVKPMQN